MLYENLPYNGLLHRASKAEARARSAARHARRPKNQPLPQTRRFYPTTLDELDLARHKIVDPRILRTTRPLPNDPQEVREARRELLESIYDRTVRPRSYPDNDPIDLARVKLRNLLQKHRARSN